MRKEIPINSVSVDYEGLLNVFVKQITETEKDNIISIFLTGSFARGEATETSDLDIWCIFKELSAEALSKIGLAVQNLPIRYDQLEINSQCLTLNEFQSDSFSRFLSYPIIYFESVLLWGDDLAIRAVQDEQAERICKEFLAEILLSIRHYIAVNEPAEKLTFYKIKT
ncbi:MAG: nucleotidyltransferase domain-containing protein [Eubacteriales bacterium]